MWWKAVIQVVSALVNAGQRSKSAQGSGGKWAIGFFIVLFAILLIVLLPMIVFSSPTGIFFSTNEEYEKVGNETISAVISSVASDYSKELTKAKSPNPLITPDSVTVNLDTMNNWKETLAVFTVYEMLKYDEEPVMVWTEDKIGRFSKFYEKTHPISSTLDKVETPSADGSGETTTSVVLVIEAKGMSVEEMVTEYRLDDEQQVMLDALLSEDCGGAWDELLGDIAVSFGGGNGDSDIVAVALSQVGNVGGQPYWSWYGFPSWVDWCACFASWCANECGYIDAGICPKFASCSQGVNWFKHRGQWQDRNYTPSPGDFIFIDWGANGSLDHVEIVTRVEGRTVFTVGGNRNGGSGKCIEYSFTLGSRVIYGYGTPAYPQDPIVEGVERNE